jgi:hypothetical protein
VVHGANVDAAMTKDVDDDERRFQVHEHAFLSTQQ